MFLRVAFLICTLFVSAQWSFALEAPFSMESLAEKSDRIVRGRVMKLSYSHGTNEYGDELIYTHVKIRVSESLKGDRSDLTLKVEGGTLNGITLTVSDAARFQPGEEVLIFAKRDLLEFRPLTRQSSKFTISSGGKVMQNGKQYTQFRTEILRAVHEGRVH